MGEIKEFTDCIIPFEYNLKLVSLWANEYYEKDFQEPHLHGNSDFSFVIFKKIGRSNGLVFFSPSYDLIQTNAFWENKEIDIDRVIECHAIESQIVIFPSILRHMVLPSKEKEVRITYSGNIKVMTKLDKNTEHDLSIMEKEY
jgi:hypothetical protein